MAEDATTRHVKIVGDAANGLSGSGVSGGGGGDAAEAPVQRRKSRRRAVRTEEGGAPSGSPVVRVQKTDGGGTSPGTLVQLAATHVPGSNSSQARPVESAATLKGAPVGDIAPSVGGSGAVATKGPKVILAKSKTKTQKVLLAAPKQARSGGAAAAQPAVATGGAKRKTLKKLAVSLGSLSKKLHRAKTIRKRASAHTLDEVKKELQKAGLIKAESKAPEAILRQMYADFMVLKKKAL